MRKLGTARPASQLLTAARLTPKIKDGFNWHLKVAREYVDANPAD